MGSVNVKGGQWSYWARQSVVALSGFTLGMGMLMGMVTQGWAAESVTSPVANTVSNTVPNTVPNTANTASESSVAQTLATLKANGWLDARGDRAALVATLKTGLITRANFVMRRTLTAQGLTLTSRGDVDATAPNEWVWNQTRPFAQRYRVKDATITVERAGAAPEVMDFNGNPQVAQFASLFKGLVTLDVSAIETHFKVDAFLRDPKGKGWIAVLRPLDTMLAKAMTEVVLRGNPTLTAIELFAPGGDTTAVTLSPYTPAERATSPTP